MLAAPPATDASLADIVLQFSDDPLSFVRFAYPWRQKGELENERGPDATQERFLIDLGNLVRERRFDGSTPVMPVLMAASSGHGTGKSTLGAWIADWILSTRPYSIGTVTANTYPQLESRTWAAIQRWTRLCVTGHWFHIRGKGIYSKQSPDDWKILAQTCKAENAQSFAGQHARTSTSWYMFDEASHIPDEIWDVAQGGLTDGEPMFFCWGQPARKSGRFFEICFGKLRDRWSVRCIDSRESRFTNKELIAEWIADYGEDSDYVRVRVKGMAPRAGDLQFIDQDRIDAAKKRTVSTFPDDPLVAGFDVSGGGQAWNVVWFRRGLDARSMQPIRIPGEHSQERSGVLARLAEVLNDRRPGRKVSMLFVDSAYGAPYVERLKGMGFDNVAEINFGGPSPDRHQANMRAYMWQKMREWLDRGAIPPDDIVLETDLAAPGSHLNRSDQLVLESKEAMQKRGVASPDSGDALALTFAAHVPPVAAKEQPEQRFVGGFTGSWMG
ncbi:MAG: terminase [Chloroflexi bacterium]|nr:MAG: terminase [Chloroflexota bacterium]